MSTATLTRRPLGINPSPDATLGPCLSEPALWDINRGAEPGLPDDLAHSIRVAVAVCHRCPMRTACHRATLAHPPSHTCVADAKVWEGARPHDPEDWIAAAQAGPQITTRVCERAACRAEYEPRQGQQRYCSTVCGRREQIRRAYARRVARKAAAC